MTKGFKQGRSWGLFGRASRRERPFKVPPKKKSFNEGVLWGLKKNGPQKRMPMAKN